VKIDSDGKQPSADTGSDARDRVGFCHSSKQTRFKPGRSGNPKGRPKGSENRKTVLARVMGEMHEVVERGKRRRRSTLNLLLLSLRNRAAEGEVRAFRAYHDCLTRFAPQQPKHVGGYLVVPEPMTDEEFEKAVAEQQRTLAEDVHWLQRYGKSRDSAP
jgi:Family of unknown function (DUF5681)